MATTNSVGALTELFQSHTELKNRYPWFIAVNSAGVHISDDALEEIAPLEQWQLNIERPSDKDYPYEHLVILFGIRFFAISVDPIYIEPIPPMTWISRDDRRKPKNNQFCLITNMDYPDDDTTLLGYYSPSGRSFFDHTGNEIGSFDRRITHWALPLSKELSHA